MTEESYIHPTHEELREFIIGRVDDQTSARIEEHLKTCDTCNAFLNGESVQDPFIDLVRRTENDDLDESTQGQATRTLALDDSRIAGDETTNDPLEPLPFHGKSHRYQIIRHLGKGGMGSVYLAQDQQLDRMVALKIPNPEHQEDPVWTERFYREARSMATLRHPHVCPVYDVGCIDGAHYITMAYIEGKSLKEVLPQRLYSSRQAAELMQKLALALDAVHQTGVVHRDLKPANIMIDHSGEPVVMDFGLALRDRESESNLTTSHTLMGTPTYMSPEQVNAESEKIGPSTDIYSLGVILYQLLCGSLPFDGRLGSLLGKIVTESPEPPSKRIEGVDLALESICLKALAKRIEDRFDTASHMAEALERYLHGDVSARRTARSSLTWVAMALVIALVAAVAWWFPRGAISPIATTETGAANSPVVTPATRPAPSIAETPFSAKQAQAIQEQWADHLELDAEYESKHGLTFRLIPPGKFLMGSPPDEIERKDNEQLHPVELTRAYYISKHEVTQDQFEQVMGYNPSFFQKAPGDSPVEQLSWYEAMAFCEKLTKSDFDDGRLPRGFKYTLPTEAEWEFACRAGSQGAIYEGTLVMLSDMNAPALDPIAWYSGNAGVNYEDAYDSSEWSETQYEHNKAGTNPVGQKRANAWGLHDMLGNVHEWCSDWYSEAFAEIPIDPQGPASNEEYDKVYRGGGWHSDADRCRCARRKGFYISKHYYNVGFRVAAVRAPQTGWPAHVDVAWEIHDSAMILFQRGSLAQAIKALQVAIDTDPKTSLHWTDKALLLASVGEGKEYSETCRNLLSRFGNRTDFYFLERNRLVQSMCVIPNDEFVTDAARILNAAQVSKNRGSSARYERTKALVEYRQGKFSEALKAIERIWPSSKSDLPPDVGFIKALSLHELMRREEAIDAFQDARDKLEADEKKNSNLDEREATWRDVLTARLLHGEAKAILENTGSNP